MGSEGSKDQDAILESLKPTFEIASQIIKDWVIAGVAPERIYEKFIQNGVASRKYREERTESRLTNEKQILGKGGYSDDEITLAGLKLTASSTYDKVVREALLAKIKREEEKYLDRGTRSPITNFASKFLGTKPLGTSVDRLELLDRRINDCSELVIMLPTDLQPLIDKTVVESASPDTESIAKNWPINAATVKFFGGIKKFREHMHVNNFSKRELTKVST